MLEFSSNVTISYFVEASFATKPEKEPGSISARLFPEGAVLKEDLVIGVRS